MSAISPFDSQRPREYVTPVRSGPRQPLGYVQITGLSAAKNLGAPNDARMALIQAQAQDIRWRDDGTDPTSTIGMVIPSGSTLEYPGDLTKIRIIEATASATANVSFYA